MAEIETTLKEDTVVHGTCPTPGSAPQLPTPLADELEILTWLSHVRTYSATLVANGYPNCLQQFSIDTYANLGKCRVRCGGRERVRDHDGTEASGMRQGVQKREASMCTNRGNMWSIRVRTPDSEDDDLSVETPQRWIQRQEWYMLTINAHDNYMHLPDDQRAVRTRSLREIKELILNTQCRSWRREKRRSYERLMPVLSEDFVGGTEKATNTSSSALAIWSGTAVDVTTYPNALKDLRRTSNWTYKEATACLRGRKTVRSEARKRWEYRNSSKNNNWGFAR